MQFWESRYTKTEAVTLLKLTWNEGLLTHSQESVLVPETRLLTQRSRRSPKQDKLAIWGILAKEGPHEIFSES